MTASERIRLNRASRRVTKAVMDLRVAKDELDAAAEEYEQALRIVAAGKDIDKLAEKWASSEEWAS
jgi:hypothetical protein